MNTLDNNSFMGCTPGKAIKGNTLGKNLSVPTIIVEDADFSLQEDPQRLSRVPDDQLNTKLESVENAGEVYDNLLIVAPSNAPELDLNEPDVSYSLHYAYGYSGHSFRNNIFLSSDKNIVYSVAAVGVILNPADNTQSFFGGKTIAEAVNQHDDDITCLSISKDRKKVASGQAGRKPKLFIWEADTGEYIGRYVLTDGNVHGVAMCSFSDDGERIALVDFSDNRVIHIIDDKGSLLWKEQSGMKVIAGICWNKDNGLIVCGKGKVSFWNIETKEVIKGEGIGTETISCIDSNSEHECFTGSVLGIIYVFKGIKVIEKIVDAHKGKIVTLIVWKNNLITGGEDMKVIVRDKNNLITMYEMRCNSVPRGVDLFDQLMVIGDEKGGITLYRNKMEIAVWLGHFSGEVCGLDVNDDIVVTAGEDNRVILWDYHKCKAVAVGCIGSNPSNNAEGYSGSKCSRAVCINVKNEEVAIGGNNGEVYIRDLCEIKKDKKVINCGKQIVECLRYSPNDNMLAVGTYDNSIFIFDVPEYKLIIKHKLHSFPITSIDWSVNEKYLRSLDENLGLVFWDMVSLSQDKNGLTNTKDIEWNTQSCKVGWSVQGIYTGTSCKSFIRGVDKSKDNVLLATGDKWGLVSIYNYPCGKGAKSIKLR